MPKTPLFITIPNAAIKYLKGDLINKIQNDIVTVGLVGEEDNALLTYLAYTSRKLSDPISIIIKGPTGSGKDATQRIPSLLMPPEDIIDAMILTPQALLHNEQGWLSNKILLGGERKHDDDPKQRDRTLVIRQMLSAKYVTKQSVDGQGNGVSYRQDGPIVYTETTTKDSIFREDVNRCLLINTDSSASQTRKVMLNIANKYMPGDINHSIKEDNIKQWHHSFQRALQWRDIRVPYASKLADLLSTTFVDMRRIWKSILSLVEVIAFIHQFERPLTKEGYLIANQDDYILSRKLLLGPLSYMLDPEEVLDDKMRSIFSKLPRGQEFSTSDALALTSTQAKSWIIKQLNSLCTQGVITKTMTSKGNQGSKWKIVDVVDRQKLLPNPDMLF